MDSNNGETMQEEKILTQAMMTACSHYSEVFSVATITIAKIERGLKLSNHRKHLKFKHRTNLNSKDLRTKLHKI
jgi:hypothetical protein